MAVHASEKTLREWTEAAFDHFVRAATFEDVLVALLDAGCPRDLAEKLLMFLPLACTHSLYAAHPNLFTPNFRIMDAEENVSAPRPLASEPLWEPITALVRDREKSDPQLIGRVAPYSSELDAIIQAQANGSKLENLVGSDVIFQFSRAVTFAELPQPAAQRPWWKVWG
jgi:hypothetical protein